MPVGVFTPLMSSSVWVLARPETGIQPSHTEKTSLSSRPTKKIGVAYARIAMIRSEASCHLSRRCAATRPRGIDTANATMSA